ncbi:RNA-directed DNA polymerase (reverse transcriptase)-related family protein [Striga hermonthica]|uniref:RNA-directed DNA polymerase (Reverse transcriptase)-related family protein n=1 Tax=Striga hermonthica TaxID=68872 RepID=A0A9N7N2W4_STRHE|nr:RNA-directed DNA polymerase (reverse transcriptase)-related family protein [Striga hermonthica]
MASSVGFERVDNLGKYLGMPIIHGRATHDTYANVLHKAESRLSGWKSSTLSLSGRATLIQSVVSTLPYFTMQWLPSSVCAGIDIDRRCRRFLWGSTDNQRKIHLVRWEELCQPKVEAVLGLKINAK